MNVQSSLSGVDLGGAPGNTREHATPAEGGERDWEAEARAVGWKPLPADPENPQPDEYKGDPAKWTDARSFIQLRDNNLGVMRENMHRLTDENRRLTRDLEAMRKKQEESDRKIDDLLALAKDARTSGYKQARRELEQQQREALRNGDEATFDKIEEGLKEIDAEAAKVEAVGKRTPAPADPPAQQMDPDVKAFVDANPWFVRDNFLHQQMVAEHLVVIKQHPAMPERDRLAKALASLKQKFPESFGITPGPKPEPRPAPADEPVEDMDDEPTPAPRRNASSVAAPRGAPEAPSRHRSPFERIPAAERDEARSQFKRFQSFDPDLTEGEYVETYLNPSANIVEIQAKYRSKK